ncbi:hypothetical protein HH682_04610 [Rosenbergiella sp. S61]|uniref:Phosphoribosyltransferase domain-containing protein n=1 Tax=Rosenbergiella gaditana TaxID=2726987 RepID=A0ABS5SY83_9GAMM|nr:phosphoribosyltransferase family protein [Rosenbergiella gaditana]MBT0723733.1 hypothetical protein [Rosenbergiella gaditana]
MLPVWYASVGICHWCEQKLSLDQPRCLSCALPTDTVSHSCAACQQQPILWQGTITAADYLPPLSKLLHQFKFSSHTALAAMLSRLILLNYLRYRRHYQWQKPDTVVAVPLHPKRYQQRGFNQSDLLARPLARWLACQYWPNAIRCTKLTATQHTLDRASRQSNLGQVYDATTNLCGKHVAIVDDVVTTGATAREIVKLLQLQQVASVQVWCLCRTL